MGRTSGIKTTDGKDRGELTVNGATVLTFEPNNIRVPTGTTAARPDPAEAGMIRFNTTTSKFEGYTGTAWVNLH